MSFGIFKDNYVRTYSNGVSPALNEINLNYDQVLMEETDTELEFSKSVSFNNYKKYWYSNHTNDIEKFLDVTDFGGPTAVLTDDNTVSCMHNNAMRVTQTAATASFNYGAATFTTARDLSEFRNGESSPASDYIVFVFFISDITKFDYLVIRLGDDGSNYFYYQPVAANFVTGWNVFLVKKNAFSSSGSPTTNFANIKHKLFGWVSTVSATNEYVVFQYCGLLREDDEYSNYPGGYQYYDHANTKYLNKWEVNQYLPLYFDEQLGEICIATTGEYTYDIRIYQDVRSFVLNAKMVCKQAGFTPCIEWRISSSNRIQFYIASDTMYVKVTESGTPTSYTKALTNDINRDSLVLYRIEKVDGRIQFVVTYDDDGVLETQRIETSSTFDNETTADIYLGNYSQGLGVATIQEINISHMAMFPAPEEIRTKQTIVKQADESLSSSTTLQNDDEFLVTLPANGKYKITLNLAVDATSNTPDIKTSWTFTGGASGLGTAFRRGRGPGTTATEVNVAETMCYRVENSGYTSMSYGATNARWALIEETLFIEVGAEAATMQLQWAQVTSDASAIVVKAGSTMEIEKIDERPLIDTRKFVAQAND